MRFIVSSTSLLKNLQAISGVVNSNNNLPILDDFLFELDDSELKITASDLETTMTVNLKPEKSVEPGKVALPAKLLLDIMKTFPDIPVTFSIDPKTHMLEIFAGEGKYKLSGHKSEDFPQLPVLEETTRLEMDTEVLLNAINKTLFATGNDELRPVMSGVFCEIDESSITFVATDAHKLVRLRRTGLEAMESAAFILPKKPLNQLKNILPSFSEETVNIDHNVTNAVFTFGNVKLICRLIEGKYLNYKAVIPTSNPNRLLIDRHALLTSLRRVAIFANQSTHQVRFKLSGQELVLTSEDIDFSNEARERLSCNYEGEDIEIGFNSKFMSDMLNSLDTDLIRMEMSAPNLASVILPDQDNEDENLLMLIMPVMLNQ